MLGARLRLRAFAASRTACAFAAAAANTAAACLALRAARSLLRWALAAPAPCAAASFHPAGATTSPSTRGVATPDAQSSPAWPTLPRRDDGPLPAPAAPPAPAPGCRDEGLTLNDSSRRVMGRATSYHEHPDTSTRGTYHGLGYFVVSSTASSVTLNVSGNRCKYLRVPPGRHTSVCQPPRSEGAVPCRSAPTPARLDQDLQLSRLAASLGLHRLAVAQRVHELRERHRHAVASRAAQHRHDLAIQRLVVIAHRAIPHDAAG